MKRSILVSMAAACFAAMFSGCGGSMSQEDMMRNAIRRKTDEELLVKTDSKPNPDQSPGDETADETVEVERPTGEIVRPEIERANRGGNANEKTSRLVQTRKIDPKDFQFEPLEDDPPFDGASDEDKRERSISNLKKIGEALVQFQQENGCFPAIIRSRGGRALLSWRVQLLPYLGYQDLYDAIDLTLPWNDPRNLPLLEQIPPVLQSPDRMDEKTNYLAAESTSALMGQTRVALRNIEDGTRNTLAVVEVDANWAMPWTAPADYQVNARQANAGVGHLREDGFFVVWADGTVSRIASEVPGVTLWSAFTFDGGEFFERADLALPLSEEVVPEIARPALPLNGDDPILAGPNQTEGGEDDTYDARRPARDAIPTAAEQQRVRQLAREAFQQRYEGASTRRDKRDLAVFLQHEAEKMKDDAASRYVLYDVAQKVAGEAGAPDLVLDIAEKLIDEYEVDHFDVRMRAVLMAGENRREKEDDTRLAETSLQLIDEAIAREQFDTATDLQRIASSALRDDQADYQRAQRLRKDIQKARSAYMKVKRVLERMEDNPDDPDINAIVGSYYCFTKQQWDLGLSMLAKGSDPLLAALAGGDIAAQTDLTTARKIADRWWDAAEDRVEHERAMRKRAVYWYRQSLPLLEEALVRVKVETRIREAENQFGK